MMRPWPFFKISLSIDNLIEINCNETESRHEEATRVTDFKHYIVHGG